MLITLLLPLRVPEPCDLSSILSTWLEDENFDDEASEHNPRPNFNDDTNIQDDLQFLNNLRHDIGKYLQDGYDDALAHMKLLQDYASALQIAVDRGFPKNDLEGEGLTLTWKVLTDDHRGLISGSGTGQNQSQQKESHHSLLWERANVLYNIAVLHTYNAASLYSSSQQQEQQVEVEKSNNNNANTSRMVWTKIGQELQNAATIVQYIREVILHSTGTLHSSLTFASSFLQVWENFLLAEAQRSNYEYFKCQSRPKHFLLAKLAAAAVPLYQTVEDLCATSDARFGSIELILDWEDSVRAWGMWMTCCMEYHQSIVHREKSQSSSSQQESGLELSRLEGALKFGSFCKDFCDNSTDGNNLLETLTEQVNTALEEMEERFELAKIDFPNEDDIPDHDELTEIPPQQTAKTDLEHISQLLPNLEQPLFVSSMSSLDPNARKYVDLLRLYIQQKIIGRYEQQSEEKTESARNALAVVNLPHSLTSYRQETAIGGGGGIPEELWERIQELQQDNDSHNRSFDERLKEQLWKIRQLADKARTIFGQIDEQLEDDLECDTLYRQQHPNFEGHDVKDIQDSFRVAMQNYHRLISSASDSDAVLLQRFYVIETDSKFRLLKLSKSQLDRLIMPPARGNNNAQDDNDDNNNESDIRIDVSVLSNYLVDLSALFNKRDSMIHAMKERGKTYRITDELKKVRNDMDYQQAVTRAQTSFQDLISLVEDNLDVQTGLLHKIMEENDRFMRVRDQTHAAAAAAAAAAAHNSNNNNNSDSSSSALVRIEDALNEIEQFSKHLREGNDFYDVVIPKLEKLLHQVREVSTRLAQERRDYEEYAARQRGPPEPPQPRYAGGGGPGMYSSRDSNTNNDRSNNYRSRPAAASASAAASSSSSRPSAAAGGGVRVDDEKVANLVAMDFDPERVVAALTKHINNFEQALNELLSG